MLAEVKLITTRTQRKATQMMYLTLIHVTKPNTTALLEKGKKFNYKVLFSFSSSQSRCKAWFLPLHSHWLLFPKPILAANDDVPGLLHAW